MTNIHRNTVKHCVLFLVSFLLFSIFETVALKQIGMPFVSKLCICLRILSDAAPEYNQTQPVAYPPFV